MHASGCLNLEFGGGKSVNVKRVEESAHRSLQRERPTREIAEIHHHHFSARSEMTAAVFEGAEGLVHHRKAVGKQDAVGANAEDGLDVGIFRKALIDDRKRGLSAGVLQHGVTRLDAAEPSCGTLSMELS